MDGRVKGAAETIQRGSEKLSEPPYTTGCHSILQLYRI